MNDHAGVNQMTSGQRGAEAARRLPSDLPPAGQRRTVRLAGLPRQVAHGREFARTALTDWRWPGEEAVEDLLLIVSELVANARLHAGGAVQLSLHASAERLRIEVSDAIRTPPALSLPHRPGLPGGHGLHIVQRLSDDWGVAVHADGKVVWAEVLTPAAEADPGA
ncbi:ATP-binding protein [Kitasatospora sp. NPDC048540]|uniref:ATP-binding protein n=1 Tax=unclassified Kitasatospora TaxID=2633591 RepID=UPI00068E49A8|nr:ATP-binding protein [Kitasatospora sp. MBT63]